VVLSLTLVPVRVETLGEFNAPNPWSGDRPEKWTLNFYRLVSETVAPTVTRPERLRKKPKDGGGPAGRRSVIQGCKLSRSETIGIQSSDGRFHALPRVLADLWQAGEVQDAVLPAMLKQVEPSLKRSDFKPNRTRLVIKSEAIIVMILGLFFSALWVAGHVVPALDDPDLDMAGWLGSLLLAVTLPTLILFGRAWKRRDDRLRDEFRAALNRSRGAGIVALAGCSERPASAF